MMERCKCSICGLYSYKTSPDVVKGGCPYCGEEVAGEMEEERSDDKEQQEKYRFSAMVVLGGIGLCGLIVLLAAVWQ